MTWDIKDNQIIFSNGEIVSFELQIRDATEIGDVIVVILKVPIDKTMNENVFGLSKEGKIVWQIERTALTLTDPVNYFVGFVSHPSITHTSINRVAIDSYSGLLVIVDVATGKIVGTDFRK